MATYREIQEFVFSTRGYTPRGCWIADVKEEHHLTQRRARNRREDGKRANPCPKAKREDILAALRHFRML